MPTSHELQILSLTHFFSLLSHDALEGGNMMVYHCWIVSIHEKLNILTLCVSLLVQPWYEGFMGTFEGFGSCHCYKWHWWHSTMYILRLWHCWSSVGNNGVTSMLNKHFTLYGLITFALVSCWCPQFVQIVCSCLTTGIYFRLLQLIWWLELSTREDIMVLPSAFHPPVNCCRYSCLLLQF